MKKLEINELVKKNSRVGVVVYLEKGESLTWDENGHLFIKNKVSHDGNLCLSDSIGEDFFAANGKVKEIVEGKNEKESDKTLRPRFTKRELKTNPVQLTDGTQILCDIYAVNEGKSNRKGVGAYLMQDIETEFKTLEDKFDFIPSYALVDAAIIRCNQFKDEVETSDWFEEFKNLARKDEKANRKQTNIKLTQETIKAIDELSRHFYFLNKTEIINLCMFVLSKSAQNSFLKNKNY